MHRRTVLGTLATGVAMLLAGCPGSGVEGAVVSNETTLTISHEYVTQGTSSGTRIVVDVTLENDGRDPITPEGRVPKITCTFLNGSGERLHESGRELVQAIGVGETTALEFTLSVDVDDESRYELRCEWTDG